ncbi:lactonase family protein [Maribacter sp. Hel_I_7]|uniref:lactonase family protein n=1 Tax=Maribacter sp. Hel_I_7 TaxID=1249997 RepID=UPI000479FF4C|nr:lactonase family protein [Maribacter sp. Hel_I_7]
MKNITFFIGSYTEYPIPDFGGIGHGIYSVEMNTDTGELSVRHTIKTRNPSYLAISDDNRFLYAVSELDESNYPMVKSFAINTDSSLSFLNEQLIPGGYPCHIISHEKNVIVACYVSGNIIQYSTTVNGELNYNMTEFKHQGLSVNADRQEGPHAHQVVVHPNGKDVFVCDLGTDMIKAYQLEENVLIPNPIKDCKLPEGSGPRHLVFNVKGDLAYVINELTGTVSVLKFHEDWFKEVHSYTSLPKEYLGTPSSSAIRIHPNGKFLYVANRKVESITVFKINDRKLKLVDIQYTKGEELREFNITPEGNWLIACHQNSHDTVIYAIKKDGRLLEINRTKEILSPSCITLKKMNKN